jgi:hypothetical protein
MLDTHAGHPLGQHLPFLLQVNKFLHFASTTLRQTSESPHTNFLLGVPRDYLSDQGADHFALLVECASRRFDVLTKVLGFPNRKAAAPT